MHPVTGESPPRCGPPGENAAALAVVAPAAAGLGVRSLVLDAVAASLARPGEPGSFVPTAWASYRKSNLDSTHVRVVRKGCVVSHGGDRLEVVKVHTGKFIGVHLDAFGRRTQTTESRYCREVVVVRSPGHK